MPAQIGEKSREMSRGKFWSYCKAAVGAARHRAKRTGLPFDIDAYAIDELLVIQKWRCAVSGIELVAPSIKSKSGRSPFGPSLDRIIPALGYVEGNLRITCNMVNFAINEWGVESLHKLVRAMSVATQSTPSPIQI